MKLNKEQKQKIDFVRNEIEELQSVIDLKYLNLVEPLRDSGSLSKSQEDWLWDYIMNPTCNSELTEWHLFEKELLCF